MGPGPPLIVFVVGMPLWFILTLVTRNPALAAVLAGIVVFLAA